MKRFHVHVHVDDIDRSVAFYSALFAAEPTRLEADYAKWMLDDPRINFAISTRGGALGVDHLGLQTDDADELAELKSRALTADLSLFDEGATTCCYANSEKHWVTDPQGVAWEHFHTLADIPVFSENIAASAASAEAATACCASKTDTKRPLDVSIRAATRCCASPSSREAGASAAI